MNFLEVLESRRSIRKFKPDMIPDNYITDILEAGRLAPSGTNLQPTRYIVIKNKESIEKLKECTPLPFVPSAPVIIACCVDTHVMATSADRFKELREAKAFVDTPLDSNDYSKRRKSMDQNTFNSYLYLNAAIAIDHITLRATDLGLGSCWVMMFDKDKTRELLELDERYEIVALIPIGYPNQSPAQRPRLDIKELILKEV